VRIYWLSIDLCTQIGDAVCTLTAATARRLYAASQIAVGVAEERADGQFDRLKSLPIPRAAPLLARVLVTTGLLVDSLAVNLPVGFALGFRTGWTLEGALAAGALVVAFAFALAWVFMALGLLAKNAQAASGYGFSSPPSRSSPGAFVPVSTLPEWLQPVARHQPVNVIVEAARGLVLPSYVDAASPLLAAAWIAVLVLVFAPYAVWLYART
jgi:hypothetical protein